MNIEKLPNLLELIVPIIPALGAIYGAVKAKKFVSVRQTKAAYETEGIDPEVKEALRRKMNEDIVWSAFSIRYSTKKGRKLINIYNDGGIQSNNLEPGSWKLNDELEVSSPRWNKIELMLFKAMGLPCLAFLVLSFIGIFASVTSPNPLLNIVIYAMTGITSVYLLIPILLLRAPGSASELIAKKVREKRDAHRS